MQYRISDPKIFDILTRNRIHFWPDLNCHGTGLNIPSGSTTRLQDGSILENQGNRKLVLIKEGTPPPAGLIKLNREYLCETGWGSVIENDHCGNLTVWQYDGWKICVECMKVMANMNSDNEEAFAPALEEEARKDNVTRFFLATGAYAVTHFPDTIRLGESISTDEFLDLIQIGLQWDMRLYA